VGEVWPPSAPVLPFIGNLAAHVTGLWLKR
jgi:hypothetical protein